MTNTTDRATVNSRDWWEDYFAGSWEANNGRGQTKYFMRRLIEKLPPAEREYLATREASVLDWGCAFGEGVEALAEAFPRCRAAGLDFAERAVAEARRSFPQLDFRHSPDGSIDGRFDAIFCSHCLEHFSDPLEVMRRHLRSCRGFYALMVPYKESPLVGSHLSRFDDASFPERLDGFARVAVEIMDSDPACWRGKMILVVYASPEYLRGREKLDLQIRERRKWDDYYAALSLHEMHAPVRKFGEELAGEIFKFLPEGSSVLEAGCGAGWQSMILAESGKLKVALMDFSPEALNFARRSFEHRGFAAEYVCGNVFEPGREEFDLVFNAGVLEHYTFDEQTAFLRGMASRSKKYVLVLVPNRHCYWYWIWRVVNAARGAWPYGKEVPLSNLSAAFEAAGLTFVGEWFGGGDWSEDFISELPGLDGDLRDQILAVHRSGIVPPPQRSYLVAALGCKGTADRVPSGWDPSSGANDFTLDQITASLSDGLAAAVAAEHRSKRSEAAVAEIEKAFAALQEKLEQRAAEIDRLSKELAEKERLAQELANLKRSRGYRMLEKLRRIKSRLVPAGSRRESAARLGWRAARGLKTPRQSAKRLLRRVPGPGVFRRGRNAALPATSELGAGPDLLVPGLVSVVLPVYNHAGLLRQAVESVLAQSYRPLELIVVNDGSTDGVESVLAKYAGHPLVRVLAQPNQGLPKALSNGFEFARGEFWTWTSADNRMHPEQLSRLVEYLQKHAETAMVYADYTAIDAGGRPLRDPKFRPQNRRRPQDPEIHLPDAKSFGESMDNFIGPCFLYRGRVGRLLGEYDPTQGIEDFDYWLRLGLVGRIDHLDDERPLYYYRVHDDSLSGRALELKIYDHARDLMDYHRARKEYFAKPWTIHADAATLAWLRPVAGGHRIVLWNGKAFPTSERSPNTFGICQCEPPSPPAPLPKGEGSSCWLVAKSEKHMILVRGDGLTAEARRGAEGVPAAVWFPPSDGSADHFEIEAALAADLCFAADDATAAQLAACVPRVFCASPGRELLDTAVNWADNRTFFESTRPPAERARTLPRPWRRKKRPASILLQVDNFLQGGLEQVVIDLACSLAAERFGVSLLVLGRLERDMSWAREAGVEVLRLPEQDRPRHYRRLLRQRRIELVNAHFSLFGAPIAAELGVPFVQTIHNTYVFLSSDGVAAYRANDRYTAAYTCVSRMVARYSAAAMGLPASKMLVVPNGVDLARLDAAGPSDRQDLRRELGLKDGDFAFLNVGAIQPVKLHVPLVHAFAEVKREHPDAKLLLVGRAVKDEFLEAVRRAVARHGLEDSVLMPGLRDDVPRFYAAADAFVLPSLFEGWSLALAEALAAGLPAAATGVGSAPELLPLVGGRLVQPPFGSIANLNIDNLDRYAAETDPRFVAELADAMKELRVKRPRPALPEQLRRSFDRREAYKTYGQLFLWLLGGGCPAAARAWSDGRAAAEPATPDVKAAVA